MGRSEFSRGNRLSDACIWLSVGGPGVARFVLMVMQAGRVRGCVRSDAVKYSRLQHRNIAKYGIIS
jgi:hypothetical protein